MPSITVRNLDEDLKQRLKEQAEKHGWSMEEEVRRILAAALPEQQVKAEPAEKGAIMPSKGLGTEIHDYFKPVALTEEEYAIFTSAFERSEAGNGSPNSERTSSNPC